MPESLVKVVKPSFIDMYLVEGVKKTGFYIDPPIILINNQLK